MRSRLLIPCALAGCVPIAATVSMRLGSDYLGTHIAHKVNRAVQSWARHPKPHNEHPAPSSDPLPSEPPENDLSAPTNLPRRQSSSAYPMTRSAPATQGIYVARATVRTAVRAGLRPSGTPVSATDDHPAGLIVSGLGNVGGLRDGDIITKVQGRTPSSVEDVLAAVSACYQRKIYVLSGEFWRGAEKWNAVVELPEPKTGDATSP